MRCLFIILVSVVFACPVYAEPSKTTTRSAADMARLLVSEALPAAKVTVKGQPKNQVKVHLVNRVDQAIQTRKKLLSKRKARLLTNRRKAATHIRVGHGRCLGTAACR